MKILLVTTSYPDYAGSNRGIFIRKYCLELTKLGLDVTVLTPRIFKQSPYLEEDNGIRVCRFWFPSSETPLNQMGAIPLLPMLVYMLSGLIKALLLCRKENPDIIHGNWIVPTGLIASLAGFFARVPVINTARGMDMRVSERGPIKYLFDLAVLLSKKVTVVSAAMRSRTVLKDAQIISSGVDSLFFDISPDYHSHTVLYSRSFEPVYDVQTLVKSIPIVLKRFPDARFIIAGTGSLESEIKNLADSLGISVQVDFPGLVSHGQISSYMKQSSVYASPAIADGTSLALLEAMAAGLIPVVTDIEPNTLLVSHGKDGYLFKPQDEKDLADKIINALNREIPIVVLNEKKKRIKDHFHWGTVAKNFIALYNQLLNNPAKG